MKKYLGLALGRGAFELTDVKSTNEYRLLDATRRVTKLVSETVFFQISIQAGLTFRDTILRTKISMASEDKTTEDETKTEEDSCKDRNENF